MKEPKLKWIFLLLVCSIFITGNTQLVMSNSDVYYSVSSIEDGWNNMKASFTFTKDGYLEFELDSDIIRFCEQEQEHCLTFTNNMGPVKDSFEVASLFENGLQQMITYYNGSFNGYIINVNNSVGEFVLEERQIVDYEAFVDLYDRDEQWHVNPYEYKGKMTAEQFREIETKVFEITKNIVSEYDKLIAIHDWIASNIHYDYDCYYKKICLSQNPYETFSNKRGVCSHYSSLADMMLKIAGIPTIYIAGSVERFGFENMLGHAWNASYINDRWLIFDVTWASNKEYTNGVYSTKGNLTKLFFDLSLNVASLVRDIDYISFYPVSYQERPISIETINPPNKIHYVRGENIDLSGARIVIVLRNDNHIVVNNSSLVISGFNTHSKYFGPQSITVTYQGFTTSFRVYLNRFLDVPYGHQTYARINDLAEKSIINGYQDNTFRPNNYITRAQAAVMIVRALGIDQRGKTSSFVDVPSTHASYEFISAAYEAGIISGYSSDNSFRPNDNITRQQIAVMIMRAFNVVHSGDNISFSDVPNSMPSQRFIEALASNGIINGYSDGTFIPTNNTTRAQFSSMIYNALRYK